MKERVSGFRVRGSWGEVVAHGERIARALRESDADENALAEWEDWRPKAHEELGEELSEKTVKKGEHRRRCWRTGRTGSRRGC